MKAYITVKQALSILPDGDEIHTFRNAAFGLMGCDWSRAELEDKITKSDCLELTGEMAKGMNHGLCAYDKSATKQSEILFIETNSDKLERLETLIAKEDTTNDK